MADLIDRAALLVDIDEAVIISGRLGETNAEMRGANKVTHRIKVAKAVDAVEVVRCKDCKHWEEIKHGHGWCCASTPNHALTKDDDYCSHGERRTDATD